MHCASCSRTTRSCNRRESSRGRHARSSQGASLPTRPTANRPWGLPYPLAPRVASTAGSAAKIWISLGITTLISSGRRMILMSLRITTNKLLLLLRHSLREAVQPLQHPQNQSISLSPKRREQRKSPRQTQPQILLRQMTTAIRRRKRRPLLLRLA